MEKSHSHQKALLREEYKRKRSTIGDADRREWDKAISSKVFSLPTVSAAGVVFVYLSRPGEVSTTSLIDMWLEQGKRVLTPSPDIRALPQDGFFSVSSRANSQAAFVPAPSLEAQVQDIDVVLIPGIVWDRNGYRIGFGGGYFDRLLTMLRPDTLRIGLAYECQIAKEVSREPWDERANIIVTESNLYGQEEAVLKVK